LKWFSSFEAFSALDSVPDLLWVRFLKGLLGLDSKVFRDFLSVVRIVGGGLVWGAASEILRPAEERGTQDDVRLKMKGVESEPDNLHARLLTTALFLRIAVTFNAGSARHRSLAPASAFL